MGRLQQRRRNICSAATAYATSKDGQHSNREDCPLRLHFLTHFLVFTLYCGNRLPCANLIELLLFPWMPSPKSVPRLQPFGQWPADICQPLPVDGLEPPIQRS